MSEKWVEIWGEEKNSSDLVMLFKFPADQWTNEFAAETLAMLKANGVTEVEVRET